MDENQENVCLVAQKTLTVTCNIEYRKLVKLQQDISFESKQENDILQLIIIIIIILS